MGDTEIASSEKEERLLDFLFFVRNGKITLQFPCDTFLVPDCAYFCQPEGTHVNTCQGQHFAIFMFTLPFFQKVARQQRKTRHLSLP